MSNETGYVRGWRVKVLARCVVCVVLVAVLLGVHAAESGGSGAAGDRGGNCKKVIAGLEVRGGSVPLEIVRDSLKVAFDPGAGVYSITDTVSGRMIVRDGRLEGGAVSAEVAPAQDSRFGVGQRIVIRQADGATVSLEIYPGLPFVLIRKNLVNAAGAEADLPRVVTTTFLVDLGVSCGQLRTLGTGGLTEPDKQPGSYVFLACANPADRRGVVAGWLTHDRGSGVLFSGVRDGQVEFKAQIDYGHLRIKPGGSAELETLAIGGFEDARLGLEQFADAVRRQYAITLRPRSATYCTWYADSHGGAGDAPSTVELARFVARELKPFGLEVLQIDDQWQDGPELDGPRRGFERARPDGPYPNGIEPVARAVNELGLVLGLWWLPFGRNDADPAWKDRQDWFAKWADGKVMRTKMFGGTCLDLTHPAVQEHLAAIAKSYRQWGVKYYKMDGLWTGTATELAYINDGYLDDRMENVAPFRDPSKTQVEAFRDGMKLLRRSAGDDVFFSGCCISQNMRSFGASFGLVDSMRIGPDFNHDGLGLKTGPIRASRLYFLNGRVWWNDPDPAKVRATAAVDSPDKKSGGAVSLEMAQLTASFAAMTGQILLLSDWLPNLPPDRIEVLKRTLRAHDAVVRPVDYFDRFLPCVWALVDERAGVRRDVIGLFNWEDKPQSLGVVLARAGLDPAKKYHVFDFWNNRMLPDVKGELAAELPAQSCRILALRAEEGRPLLLSTSAHITQGVVDVVREQWDGHVLSGESRVVAGDACELRIRVPAGWRYEGSDMTGVTAEQGDGMVRLRVNPDRTGALKWSARFTR